VRQNDFVRNNSRMSIDRPKPAIVTLEREFMRKCDNQRCVSKTAKETLMQCDVRCNSIHKSIK